MSQLFSPCRSESKWTPYQSMAVLLLNRAISQTDTSPGTFGFYCMLKCHKLFSVPAHILYTCLETSTWLVQHNYICYTLAWPQLITGNNYSIINIVKSMHETPLHISFKAHFIICMFDTSDCVMLRSNFPGCSRSPHNTCKSQVYVNLLTEWPT